MLPVTPVHVLFKLIAYVFKYANYLIKYAK